jgi:hypothetical protein
MKAQKLWSQLTTDGKCTAKSIFKGAGPCVQPYHLPWYVWLKIVVKLSPVEAYTGRGDTVPHILCSVVNGSELESRLLLDESWVVSRPVDKEKNTFTCREPNTG